METIPVLEKLYDYGNKGQRVPIKGTDVQLLLKGYQSLTELLPDNESSAILDPRNDRLPLSHSCLKSFVSSEFNLNKFGISGGARIGVLIPNGPELAVCLVALLAGYCAAPINPIVTPTEIKSELENTKCVAVIVLADDNSAIEAVSNLPLTILKLYPSSTVTGMFSLESLDFPTGNSSTAERKSRRPSAPGATVTCNKSSDTVLLLHTSGTSGHKKLVPYSLDMVVVGVGCIISSWNLSSADICLNMMPLFHIGGIVRNIFSPVLSGGCVITCSAFDPVTFWDILYREKFTWYYAAPTMHHAVLQEASRRQIDGPLPVESVRFIANAAGGLLPILAESLQKMFQATILTSYGMTECMPISTPSQNYKLSPVGTSGTAVGPDILIVSDDGQFTPVPVGEKGSIMIRGPPCFGGYEVSAGDGITESNQSSSVFHEINGQEGWFDTGDLGHLDKDGCLFISGRSKEIINRGGETISPFEIEEAMQQHPAISEVMCFASPHNQFQETVGAVIVTSKATPRPDLYVLHKFLDQYLHRSKWPQVLVYMKALPKNAAGKILRVRFAERAALAAIDEDTSPVLRLFEGECPVPGAPLSSYVSISPVQLNLKATEAFLREQDGVGEAVVVFLDMPSRRDAVVAFVSPPAVDCKSIMDVCSTTLPAYMCPLFIYGTESRLLSESNGRSQLPDTLLGEAVEAFASRTVILPRTDIEKELENIWREQLMFERALSVTSSFFELGGDSLRAGSLVNAIRRAFGVAITVADLFSSPTIEGMAHKINFLRTIESNQVLDEADNRYDDPSADAGDGVHRGVHEAEGVGGGAELYDETENWEYSMKCSSTSPVCLIVQLIPFALVFPIRRLSMWFLIATPWVMLMNVGVARFPALIMAMIIMRALSESLFPLVGIACKWLIIGKYKAGRYPLWGTMYLKWWLVEQIIRILGKGIYRDDFPIFGTFLVRFYYVLMGASIGKNVRIHRRALISQADMIAIGDDVIIDDAVIQPFALEEGHMVLLPIVIGDRCSIGVKSTIAPGAVLVSGTHIGPLSSSHEQEDAEAKNRKYCRPAFPSPPFWMVVLIGMPIMAVVAMVSYVPWVLVLHSMVADARSEGWYKAELTSVYGAFLWWITPQRMVYYFALRIIQRCIVPPVRLLLVVLIKWAVIGKFTPMSSQERHNPIYLFRYWLMSKLLPGGDLGGVAQLVGTHYEVISVIYRMLGANIGKRVYWPGSGLDIVEYDLLEVGDDVVFGSRSVVMTSSAESSAHIRFEAGSMVADRCVVLPGVELRRGCVLGSGSLAPEGFEGPTGSMWVGSRDGCTVLVSPEDDAYSDKASNSPFGNAFYGDKAKYFVIPLWMVIPYNFIWRGFCVCYHNCPLLLSLVLAQYFAHFNDASLSHGLSLFRVSITAFIPVYISLSLLAIGFDIAMKWILIGRRAQGYYSWEDSSYCQRWQLHLTLQEIRRGERENTGILDMVCGSTYLVWYFRAMGCQIGKDVCLYPNGGDPMMTEPDLVTIGDDCAVDNASLIAHINTRGYFRLNPIHVGNGCVLKTNTRLLSGSGMENNSILLEHTLVISGERVDAGAVWQGWPSQVHYPLGEHRIGLNNLLSARDLELMSIFLSTNSASSLATMKRRKRRRRAEKAEMSARTSGVSNISTSESSGFLSRIASRSYEKLQDDDL